MADDLKYSLEISVNRVLTETEKNKLMNALSSAIEDALGQIKSGTMMVYSEKK